MQTNLRQLFRVSKQYLLCCLCGCLTGLERNTPFAHPYVPPLGASPKGASMFCAS